MNRAPDFVLPGVDGKTYTLASVRGANATIIVFSCNHCPYVVMNEDRLITIFADYKDKGVGMAAINSNDALNYPEDSLEKMKERAKTKGFPFPYLHDESQGVARAYGATHTPHLFVFDADLKLAYTGCVDDDNNYSRRKKAEKHFLRDALDDLAAGRAPRLAETHAVGCTIKWR